MTVKKLGRIKEVIVPILRRNGVVKAGIFGSSARGEQNKKSDVDILVKFKGDVSLLKVIGLEGEIEKKIRKMVDLITYRSLHPLLKDRILQEEVRIL
ncbi:nucleotidyltransferase family protein [Candidatus Woesearchaeota archaeon]|nr:nucleotidyltransferase family protein [Candidatus Woesearchaeota archaeon]